jgi:predicted dehydrogenase
VSKHRLLIVNPGHFHAALTLRERSPLIEDDIHVFAEDGPELEDFLRLVHAFNDRPVDPTRWTLYVHRGADYLEQLVATRPGNVVILAGINSEKLPLIHFLHGQGFTVLGDKPWLIDSGQFDMLKEVTAGGSPARDIMTERHEIANRLQRALMRQPELFGTLRRDGDVPAVEMRSVHHLSKLVNGNPLRRPAWYFDTAMQGEGISDVTTHLVDLVQWMLDDGTRFDLDRDVAGLAARQWPTVVPGDVFARVTGLDEFPRTLQQHVVEGALHYLCNASIAFRLRGAPVELEALWGLQEPAGSGDLHHAVVRGTRAELIVSQGPETGFLSAVTVKPVHSSKDIATALADALTLLQDEFPGVGSVPEGENFRLIIPSHLRSTHEQHFAAVVRDFLGTLEEGANARSVAADLEFKYGLLSRALALSHRTVKVGPQGGLHA